MRAAFVCSSAFAPRVLNRSARYRKAKSTPKRERRINTTASASNGSEEPRKSISKACKIACIGDIHGQWDDTDESALRNLKPDLALFVGDYGDEDVRVTSRIAAFAKDVDFGIATVFGNHDAFFTASPTGRRRAPYNKSKICRVTDQMEMLAPFDVSYRSVPFDNLGVSICGGRSFSVGGPNWKYNDFYQKFVGVYGLDHSTSKLKEAVGSSKHDAVVFLSHSGPTGLGDKISDPCGKDWGKKPGGDYGDQDLRDAIENAREKGLRVPLTVFGHMHSQLMYGQGHRTMLKVEPDGDTGHNTVMLNAAVFPRHKVGPQSASRLRHFQLVDLGDHGYVNGVEEVWVSISGEIVERTSLLTMGEVAGGEVKKGSDFIIQKAYPRKNASAT